MSIFLCVSSLEDDSNQFVSTKIIWSPPFQTVNSANRNGQVQLQVHGRERGGPFHFWWLGSLGSSDHLQCFQNDIVGDGVHQPNIWVFPKIELPQNGWFIILPLFSETPIWGFTCPKNIEGSGWRVRTRIYASAVFDAFCQKSLG